MIKTTDDPLIYEGVRALWSEVFGDPLLFIDSFYETFGDDIKGYAAVDEEGRVCSALTCYLCGTYGGAPVYVSYAVCTAPGMRGSGLAGMLTEHIRDMVTAKGGISIVSPAEPSLEGFYAGLGYEPHFFAAENAVLSTLLDDEEFDDFDEFDIDIEGSGSGEAAAVQFTVQQTAAEVYNRYREAFLAEVPHIELSEAMLKFIEAEYTLCVINGGDAICAVADADPGRTVLAELITSPVLLELSLDIDTEIASMAASHLGSAETVYRTPGAGRCQSMAAGIQVHDTPEYALPYFGFPVD